MTSEEEQELLSKIKHDPSLFGVVFDENYRVIFGYLYRRLGDYDLARDMAAETFLKAFLNIKRFTWRGHRITAWLYRIANNEINQFIRKKRYRPSTWDDAVGMLPPSLITTYENEKANAEDEMLKHNEFLQVQTTLKKMDIKYQEVIALRYFEGRDNKEIATILNKPEGTIKSLLSRGMHQLRMLIEKH